ncbi:MAG: BlaI/MecI/CopY family transcriptional regulator [Pyrinomonadaceae bacterium]
MPRKPSKILTDKELEIMRIVWEAGEASVKQIQERLPGTRHYNSILTIIRVLEQKEHLTHRAEGRTFIYRAKRSREKSRRHILNHLVKYVFGGSATSLVLNLVETGDLSDEDLVEIRKEITLQRRAKEKS